MRRIAGQKWRWQVIITRNDCWNLKPDRGLITSNGTISWPIGFALPQRPNGTSNAKFVARVYGVETTKLLEFVEDFAELGAHFNLPVQHTRQE